VKHTDKNCKYCHVELTKSNWYPYQESHKIHICKSCWSLQNKSRMTVNFKRVQLGNKLHPFYSVYKTEGLLAAWKAMGILKSNKKTKLEVIKKEALAMFDKIEHGEVYIITNPAWKGWVKIGMAVEAEDRCKGYQTSSPFRDYKVVYSKKFKDRRTAEAQAHKLCSAKATDQNSEWFKIKIKDAVNLIESINEEQYEKETA